MVMSSLDSELWPLCSKFDPVESKITLTFPRRSQEEAAQDSEEEEEEEEDDWEVFDIPAYEEIHPASMVSSLSLCSKFVLTVRRQISLIPLTVFDSEVFGSVA